MTEVTLIQNFSLTGEICRKFAVSWSADDKISICTSKAIYILNSNFSPMESGFPFPIHKQAINIPKDPVHLLSKEIPYNPYKYIKTEEDKDNLHRFFMDHTLNSKITERIEAFLSFRTCRWSPKGAAKRGRCLLAALTLDHRLTLYEEQSNGWECVCDLTNILQEMKESVPEKSENDSLEKITSLKPKQLKRGRHKKINIPIEGKEPPSTSPIPHQEEKFIISRDLNYKKLQESVYKIAPMEIIWTGMFGNPSITLTDSSSEFCFLIVAMKSGHIQFWKISPSDTPYASLTHEWDTGLGMITSLCWQQTSQTSGFLMCGSLRGVLAFLPVSIALDADREPQVTIKSACNVWDEEDNIAVDHIAILKIALKKYVIIAAKMHALVGCEIVQSEKSITIRNVGHSFGLHRLPVTGMAVLDANMPQYKILMTTMEGMIVEIKVSLGNDEIKFQHEKISLDLDLKNQRIEGLAVSSNGILAAVVLDVAPYFDHLVRKEPLQFAMFVTKPFEEVYKRLQGALKFPFTSSVSRHTDFLECIRTNLACGTPLPEQLTALLDRDPATCSTLELHVIRFILHAYISGLPAEVPEDKNHEDKLRQVEAEIMRRYVSSVFRRCQENMDLLTPGQAQSLLLMADWLLREFEAPVDGVYSVLGHSVHEDPKAPPPRETCAICKADVSLNDLRVGRCAKEHVFARCCHSLLLCDAVPRLQCASCGSVALPAFWIFGSACTYCGMAMT